jgi:hypothetical protein
MQKKIIRMMVAVVAFCLAVSMFSVPTFADHPYKGGDPNIICTYSTKTYSHGSYLAIYNITHHTVDYKGDPSTVCTRTQKVYSHSVKCKVCSYSYASLSVACRIEHTYCRTETVNEPKSD